MKYIVKPSNQFNRDIRLLEKRGYDLSLLTDVIKKLASGEVLPLKNRVHALSGNLDGRFECHVANDWLLIYEIDDSVLYLYLTRTGTHSDLFKKNKR